MTIRAEHRRTGRLERIRARYVVGCDGARSFIRRKIGETPDRQATKARIGFACITAFQPIRNGECAVTSGKREGFVIAATGSLLPSCGAVRAAASAIRQTDGLEFCHIRRRVKIDMGQCGRSAGGLTGHAHRGRKCHARGIRTPVGG